MIKKNSVAVSKEKKEEERERTKEKKNAIWFVPSIVPPLPSSLYLSLILLHTTFPYQFFQKQPPFFSRPFPRTSARRLRGRWLLLLECVATLLLVLGGAGVVAFADALAR